MGRVGAVVEGRGAAGGAVDELVADDEVAALHVRLERAGRGRRQQPCHAEFVHRPKVRARWELVRRVLVLEAVARQERHATVCDGPDHDRCRRVTEGCRDGVLGRVGEEGVEAGPAEDPDLRARGH